jgi:hypothetical protein
MKLLVNSAISGHLWFYTMVTLIIASIGLVIADLWLSYVHGTTAWSYVGVLVTVLMLWLSGVAASRATVYYQKAIIELDKIEKFLTE